MGDEKLDLRKHKKKWRSRKEYELAGDVLSDLDEKVLSRRTTCPWSSEETGSADISYDSRVGSDWKVRWDEDYKLWSMYYEPLSDGRSNLKSPTSFSPVEALVAEFSEIKPGLMLSPTKAEDKGKVKLLTAAIKHWEDISKVDEVNMTTLKEAAITGTAVRRTVWKRVEREVTMVQNSQSVTQEIYETLKNGTEKEKKAIKEKILDKKQPFTTKKTVVDYDDIIHVPESIYSVYFEPGSLNVSGPTYESDSVTIVREPKLDAFMQNWKNSRDPYVKKENVSMVTSASMSYTDYGQENPFFKIPPEWQDNDSVYEIHYYCKSKDKYVVLANDIIIRDGPLPFNHKQIPVSLHKFIEWPYQLYGIGLPVILQSLQAEDETLRNMMLEQLKMEINPPLFVRDDLYDDLDTAMQEVGPGALVPVPGNPGEAVAWMPKSAYTPNFAQMRESIQQDVIKASGVNPLAYSLPKPNEAVRNNMIAMESSLKMMKKGIKMWSRGYRDAMLQTVALMRQFYPTGYIKEIDPEGKKLSVEQRSVKTEGYSLQVLSLDDPELTEADLAKGDLVTVNEDGVPVEKVVVEKVLEDGDYSFFDLKDDYLQLSGELEMTVDVDSLVPVTKAMKMQNADRFMQSILPILQNPAILENPLAVALLRYYIEQNDVPQEVFESLRDETTDQEVEEALRQNQMMLGGVEVPPIAGESVGHLDAHSQLVLALITKKRQLAMDPMTPMQVMMQLDKQIDIVATHLEGDRVPKGEQANYTLSRASQGMQPPQGPPEAMPPENNMGGPIVPQGAGPGPGNTSWSVPV